MTTHTHTTTVNAGATVAASHTAGPWAIRKLHSVSAIETNSGSRVCHLPDHFELDGIPCGSIESQDKTQAEVEANAHLIAAAPELLEALITLHDFVNDKGEWEEFEQFQNARKVIAKAEGRDA